MKSLICLFSFSFLVFDFALAQPDTLWTRVYPDLLAGTTGAEIDGGDFLLLGASNYSEPFHILRLSSNGDSIQSVALDSNYHSLSSRVLQLAPSDFVVATSTELVRFHENGSVEWSVHRYSVYPFGWYIPGKHDLIIDADGYMVVGGKMAYGMPPPYNVHECAYVEKVASTSSTIWSQHYDDEGWGVLAECQLISGAYVVILKFGESWYRIAKLDSVGNLTWSNWFAQIYSSNDAENVVPQADGGWIAGGLLPDSNAYLVKRYSSSGEVAWTAEYGGFVRGLGTVTMFARPEGGAVVCGYGSPTGNQDADLYVVAFTAEGGTIWSQTYGTEKYEWLIDACQTSDGGLLLMGGQYDQPNDTMYLYLVRLSSVMVADGISNSEPTSYTIFTYPNPFNPATTISFSLPYTSNITLAVYDITGRKVETLIDKNMNAGEHSIDFDGSALPSGLYFARLTAGDFSQTQKMVLLK